MLTTVTVTGADDSVRPEELVAIAAEYRFVEFGILFGNHPGTPRFPSLDWIAELHRKVRCAPCSVGLAVHLCGNSVTDFLSGYPTPVLDNSLFARCQINTHAEERAFGVENVRRSVRYANIRGARVIFQLDGVNHGLLLACLGTKEPYHVAGLYDLSHGAGLLPEVWEKPIPGVACGYAGGLSPGNVAEQVKKISLVAGDAPFWIDAETHLRSENDASFNLVKVERFLEAARPYVR